MPHGATFVRLVYLIPLTTSGMNLQLRSLMPCLETGTSKYFHNALIQEWVKRMCVKNHIGIFQLESIASILF